MALFPLRKIKAGPGERPPQSTLEAIGSWIGKELWALLRTTQRTVDWAVDFLGKVSVDATDEPGVLEDKIVDSATVTWQKNGAAGDRTLSATASPTSFTLPDPAADSSNLYPAKVPDPLNMGDVRCVFGEQGCTEWHTFSSGPWTQSGDTFTRGVTGTLPSSWFDGLDTMVWDASGYSTLVGQIVICPPTDDLLGDDLKTWGAYEVLDTGMHMEGAVPVYTYARLRRIGTLNASADFVQGITFHVLQGNVFGGMYATLQSASVNLGVDDQDWHFAGPGAPPSWSDSYELLTAADVVTRGASSDSLSLSATATSGSSNMATASGAYDFDTVGTLPDTLPAGKVDWYLKDVILSGSKGNGTSNVIVCQLIDNDGAGGLSVIATASTQHIDWSTLYGQSSRDLTCQGAIAADWTMVPGHYLTQRYLFYTDSTTAVSCSFTYNSADRYTKVGVTWDSATIGGTTWHPDLLGRDQPDQHPWSSMEPVGMAVQPALAISIASGGKLTLGAGNIFVVTAGGLDLNMISTPSAVGVNETAPITLIFADTVKLQHAQAPDAGFAPLCLHRVGSINNPLSFKYAKSVAQLALVGGEWVLLSFHSSQ